MPDMSDDYQPYTLCLARARQRYQLDLPAEEVVRDLADRILVSLQGCRHWLDRYFRDKVSVDLDEDLVEAIEDELLLMAMVGLIVGSEMVPSFIQCLSDQIVTTGTDDHQKTSIQTIWKIVEEKTGEETLFRMNGINLREIEG